MYDDTIIVTHENCIREHPYLSICTTPDFCNFFYKLVNLVLFPYSYLYIGKLYSFLQEDRSMCLPRGRFSVVFRSLLPSLPSVRVF